ncbi:PLAC8 motif-containing protein - like 9 [Theobroma cacao]|nr:PLAC8 motif-containing protein - like 9 [Theobroma cacao]
MEIHFGSHTEDSSTSPDQSTSFIKIEVAFFFSCFVSSSSGDTFLAETYVATNFSLCSKCCSLNAVLYVIMHHFLGCALSCLYGCYYRKKFRHQYGLEPSPCPDICVHCFCHYCALCQEQREIRKQGYDMIIGMRRN